MSSENFMLKIFQVYLIARIVVLGVDEEEITNLIFADEMGIFILLRWLNDSSMCRTPSAIVLTCQDAAVYLPTSYLIVLRM